MARPRLIGRGRALEVLLGADDMDGDLAELYGYVNRSLPDSELDSFVDSHATRISSFDEHAIGETKRLVKSTACRRRRDRAPNGTHLPLRLRARKRRREFRSCSTAAFTIPEMSRRGSGTTSVCWAAMTRETSEPTANKGIES
jgi:enoyl-CoA hydratase/carnithine racemase